MPAVCLRQEKAAEILLVEVAERKGMWLPQVLNLAPWGNVLLQLPPVRLSGAHGWSALGTSLGDQWLKEITTNQASTCRLCAQPGASKATDLTRGGTSAGPNGPLQCLVPGTAEYWCPQDHTHWLFGH